MPRMSRHPVASDAVVVPAPGQPRSAASAAFLATYERRIRVPIVLSAILPLLVAPEPGHPVSIAIGIATWLVFVVDLVVHVRHQQHYLRTRLGTFDLVIVIVTAPWFLLPGAGAGGFVVLLRLARLARLVVASRGARALFARLGRVAIVAASIMVVTALVVFLAERPTNPEFASFGDALWWSIVTLTTVGYGDIVPVTATGRLAAAALMITGIALLGLLAGSLASFLGLDPDAAGGDGSAVDDGSARPQEASADATLAEVLEELRLLRQQVDALGERPA
jgi:voltage-gated potassium channel